MYQLLTKPLLLFLTLVTVAEATDWSQVGDTISGESESDYSGQVSISDDGTRIAIGGPGHDDYTGHVRIFELYDSIWYQIGGDINGVEIDDGFGTQVSLSPDGNRLAISSPFANSARVRVFEFGNGVWTQVGGSLDAGAYTRYITMNYDGSSVAISSQHASGGGSSRGVVKVFEWSTEYGEWLQRGEDINGEADIDLSGSSLSFNSDGTILAVGASGNDANGSWSGHVRVFQWYDAMWMQIGYDIDGEAAGDNSGNAVSLSDDGTVVAIGASNNSTNGDRSGHVRVFEWDGAMWMQRGDDIDGEAAEDYFGDSVSLNSDGNILAVGARFSDGNGINSGHVRVFEWDNVFWTQVGSDIYGNENDWAGKVSISSDGTVVAVGSPAGIGYVKVFNLSIPSAPTVTLEAFYEATGNETITIDATPTSGSPRIFTYQWYLNNSPISPAFGGGSTSFSIVPDVSSEGTWRVEVTNDTGTTSAEFEYRLFVDSDSDGYSDYRESNYLGTNPNAADTDGDGLSDYAELETHNTLPTQADSNGDGFSDGAIFNMGLDLNVDYSALSQDLVDNQRDLRVGSTMIEVSDGKADITMMLEETSDLTDWSNANTSEKTIEVDATAGTRFYRFKMSE